MFSFLLGKRTRAESFVLLQKPALLFLFFLSAYPHEQLYVVSNILLFWEFLFAYRDGARVFV